MTVDRAIALQDQAWKLQAEGRLEQASITCREALRLLEEIEGPESPDVANLLNDLADIECERQNIQAALLLVERARTVEDALGRRFTGESAARIRIRTLAVAGAIRRIQGDYPRAATDLRSALAASVTEFGDTSEEAAEARNNLAVVYKYWGRFDEGLQLYEQALAAIVAMHGERSLAAGAVYHNIGGILHARGDHGAAEEPAGKAWQISRRLLGGADPRTMRDASAYAAVLDGLERYEDSEPIYRQALAIFEQAHGLEHEEVAATLHNLAAVRGARGDRHEAERCYRRALAIKEQLAGADSPDVALTRNNLGNLMTDMGRRKEAISLLEPAVAVLEKRLTPGHPHLAVARGNLRRALQLPAGGQCVRDVR